MVNTTAFASPFTGASLRLPTSPVMCNLACRRAPSAVLGRRTEAPTWEVAPPPPVTYEVTVETSNSTVVVDVDRDVDMRSALLEAAVDVYTLRGKLTNCGGMGQCGTCLVSVEQNFHNVNERNAREEKRLKDHPEWRFACCTYIDGPVTIRTKPQ